MTDLVTRHRWNVDEYAAAESAGAFVGKRCQLIEGEIHDMSPASIGHNYAIEYIRDACVRTAPQGMSSGSQSGVDLARESEPEPDVWVAAVERRELRKHKPYADQLVLIVEVCDSSYAFDSGTKLPMYARVAVPELWLVNLRRQQVEVYTQPAGDDYGHLEVLHAGDTLAFPWGATIDVAGILGVDVDE